MIKIIFFDIDGTLVPIGTHEIAPDTKQALDALRANGIKIFISSGRHRCVMDNLHDYPFDGYVCTNGSLVTVGDKVIYGRPIDRDDAITIVRIAAEQEIPLTAYLTDRISISFQNEASMRIFQMLRIPPPPSEDLSHIAASEPVYEFTPVMTAEQEPLFTPYMTDTVFVRWHPDFVDLNPIGVNKAGGMAKALEYYGFTREETMAFGDGENDIQMLEFAGTGIAMAYAPESVKAHSDYVTGAADRGGVVDALRHFGLI